MELLLWLGLGLLGGCGAILRFLLDGAVAARLASGFPAGTFVVNVLGSLALGIVVGAGVEGDGLRLAGVGLLGSFTTFSTWMLESARLAEDGEERLGILNIGLSLAAGIAIGWAGLQLGGAL